MTPVERPILWGTALLYGLVILAVGAAAAWRTRDVRDFWAAGGALSLPTVALATMAASFSGFLFVGGPGLTQRLGVGSFFLVLPAGFTAALLGWVIARPLASEVRRARALTLPEWIAGRFASDAGRAAAAVAVATGSVAYLAAQLLAVGTLMRPFLGGDEDAVRLAIVAGSVVVVLYAVVGGMKAGIWTDVVQGGVMMVAGVVVFVRALAVGGGVAGILESIRRSEQAPEGFLDPLGTAPLATVAGFVFLFGVGVLGQPHMVHKFLMLRDPERLRWFPALLGASQGLVLLVWVGIGFAVPALVARGAVEPLAAPDLATATFLLEVGPDALAGLVLAAVLAAVMSTADALLNVAAAALVRDLPTAFGRPPRRELAAGRWVSLALGLAAAAVALAWGDLVALLGAFAFGVFAASLGPVLALGAKAPPVRSWVPAAAISFGLAASLGAELLARSDANPFVAGVLPGAPALALSFLATAAFFRIGRVRIGPSKPLSAGSEPGT